MLKHQLNATSHHEQQLTEQSLRTLQRNGQENVVDPVERLRLLCLSRGANGVLSLGRVFRQTDHDGGNKMLTFNEFEAGLKQIGLEINDDELKEMFEHFDSDGNGGVDLDEFLVAIRPPLSDYRKKIIHRAFDKMDKTGNGIITVSDLKRIFNVKLHAQYIAGEVSEDAIWKKFLGNFEPGATQDGEVTKEEFLNYYSCISASIDNDCYFDLMIRKAYKL